MSDPTGNLPQNILTRLEQAEALKLEGKYRDALVILETLLLEDPSNVSALEEVADNELSLEQYDRAETAANQAIVLDTGSYTGRYILGFIRSQQGKWDDALVELRQANHLKSNNPEILRCLGWVLFNIGQKPQGIVTLERSLNLDHDNTLTLCDLGMAYLETHNLAKAKALFLRALDIDPESDRARECVAAVERMEKKVK